MKKIYLVIVLLMFGLSSYSQADTIYFSKEKFDSEIETLKIELNKSIKDNYNNAVYRSSIVEKKLLDSLKYQGKRINISIKDNYNNAVYRTSKSEKRLLDSLNSQNKRIIELENLLNLNRKALNQTSSELTFTKENLNLVKNETDSKISNLGNTINTKTILSYILFFLAIGLAIILFIFLKRRLTNNASKFDGQIESTKSQIESTKSSFKEGHMKLDEKLIKIYESQLQIQKHERESSSSKEVETDHSLALKVADEIVRMQRNISIMPEETKGLKHLSRAIKRIQDTFKVNGYEMIEMLDKPYNEGMKVIANFVPDETLESGQQIITRIIKPQVNFNKVMIQSAQIEVSLGE